MAAKTKAGGTKKKKLRKLKLHKETVKHLGASELKKVKGGQEIVDRKASKGCNEF